MIPVVLTAEAEQDIDDIAVTIARDNIDAALRFYDAVDTTCQLIAGHPNIGTRRSAVNPSLAGIRSVGVNGFRNYLFFFLPGENSVRVLRVFHGVRDLQRWLNRR